MITNHSKLNSVQLVKKDISNPFINFLSSFGCTYFAQFYGIYFTTYPACIPNNLHSSEIRGLCFMKFSYLYLSRIMKTQIGLFSFWSIFEKSEVGRNGGKIWNLIIPKIRQILKHFSGQFHLFLTSYFWSLS